MTTRNENVPPIDAYGDPFETLESCGGVYNATGRFGEYLGPLVASGGVYADDLEQKHPYVVKSYYNFGEIFQHPHILANLGQRLTIEISKKYDEIGPETLYVGMPRWGHFLALLLARNVAFGNPPRYPRAIPVEKTVKTLGTGDCPEEYSFLVKKYQVYPGDRVIVVKDVSRNSWATAGVIGQIEALGAQVIAVVCVCACSLEDNLQLSSGKKIPVIAESRRKIPLYGRTDPAIISAVKKYGIVFNPEERWDELMAIMAQAKK